MPTVEIVGQPWTEGGRCCLQLRVPQPDGSNLEPIARLAFENVAGKSDDEVAALVAEAVAELSASAEPAVPPVLTRVLSKTSFLLLAEGRISTSPLPLGEGQGEGVTPGATLVLSAVS